MSFKKKLIITVLIFAAGFTVYKVFVNYTGLSRIFKGNLFLEKKQKLEIVRESQPYLMKLKIKPQKAKITLGKTISFKAVGIYSSGEEKTLQKEVTWNSSNRDVGYMDQKGVFHAKSPGKTLIYANFGGMAENSVTISSVTLGSQESVVEVLYRQNSGLLDASNIYPDEKDNFNVPIWQQDRAIPRAEFIKVLILLNSLAKETEEIFYEYQIEGKEYAGYLDVPITDPNAKYVVAAKKLGFLKNYITLLLHPYEDISRAEALQLLFESDHRGILKMAQHNAYAKYIEKNEKYIGFKDVPRNIWYASYVAGAIDLNLITPKNFVYFEPNKKIKESELTSLALKILEINR